MPHIIDIINIEHLIYLINLEKELDVVYKYFDSQLIN